MASRRDQLQSYQFMTQRVISAFVMHETDPRQSPLRRGIGAVFGGIMVAVLVATAFGIYGLLTRTGGAAWRSDGTVVLEKETGASFVYLAGSLHPTLNYTSALLAAGRPHPRVQRVSARSLGEVPRGITIGIAGAPHSLPAALHRIGLPWTLCAAPGTDPSGRAVSTVALAVGGVPTGGRRLTAGEGVLVRTGSGGGTTYLVSGGNRYQVREPATLLPALFGAATTVVPVGTAWLNAVPAGASIGPIRVTGRGNPSPAVPGRAIGDILVAETGSGPQFYLVFDDGLAAITALQQAILRAQSAAPPVPVGVAEATSLPVSERLPRPGSEIAAPSSPPKLVSPADTDPLCAVTGNAAAGPEIVVGGTVDGLAAANPTGPAGANRTSLADRVQVPAGRVAIVRVLGAPDADLGTYHVVTDVSIRYPVPSAAVLAMLGYAAEQATDVPASLVSRIPAGPTLDPAAAIEPARIARN